MHNIPAIFDSINFEEEIPEDFNAVCIPLNGTLHSTLDWNPARKYAEQCIKKGFNLFWELDLGLLGGLRRPLSDQTQFKCLVLALHHFRDTLWREFKEYTIGLNIYRGPGDFSVGFDWDAQQMKNFDLWVTENPTSSLEDFDLKKLYCRDAASEYLNLLAANVPDELPLFILVDISSIENPLEQAKLLSRELFDRIRLGIKGSRLPLDDFAWDNGSPRHGYISRRILQQNPASAVVGICFPGTNCIEPGHYSGMQQAIEWLLKTKREFRIIPELFLTTEWDGLDYILFTPMGLGTQGKRKLQGFCAAGGIAVTLGKSLGLVHEISLQEFQNF